MGIQVLRTEGGEELVVLTRRDYDMLMALAGDEAAENLAAATFVAEDRARRAFGETSLPGWLSAAILAGEHPLRAVRKRAKLGQVELAGLIGVSQGHVSDVERGTKNLGGDAAMRAAAILDVAADWLAE